MPAIIDILVRMRDEASAGMTAVAAKAELINKAFLAVSASAAASAVAMAGAGMANAKWNEQIIRAGMLDPEAIERRSELEEKTIELSVKYGKSAADVAAAFNTLLKAGRSFDQSMTDLDPTVQAAIANISDLDLVVEMTTKAVSSFSNENISARDALNIMTIGAKESLLDFEDFAQGLASAAGSSRMMQLSFEDTIAALSTLSQVGIAGGIKFNRLLLDLLDKGEELDKIFKSIGIDQQIFVDGKVNLEGIIRAMAELDKRGEITAETFGKFADVLQMRSLAAFGGMIAAASDYDRILQSIREGGDELTKQSEYYAKSVMFQWNQLTKVFWAEILSGEFSDKFAEFLHSLQPIASELGKIFMDFAQNALRPENVQAYLNILKSLMEVMKALSPIVQTIGNIFAMFDGHMGQFIIFAVIGLKLLPMLTAGFSYLSWSISSTAQTMGVMTAMSTRTVASLTLLGSTLTRIAPYAGMFAMTMGAIGLMSDKPAEKKYGDTMMLLGGGMIMAAPYLGPAAIPVGIAGAVIGGIGAIGSFTGSFAEGTDYVPQTGLALVHKGERIIPADENRSGGGKTVVYDYSRTFINSVSREDLRRILQKRGVVG